MTSSGTQLVFSAQASAATSKTINVDNDRIVLLQVSSDGVLPNNQKLYVYASIGLPGEPSTPINPLSVASPANPYSEVMLRDLNDLDAVVGTDGITIAANSVKLYEINVSAVRDVHFKLTGGPGTAVTAVIRPYLHV